MIIVDFKDENYKRVTGLWQWDYGQVLRIQGLNLPKAVEIHFSLQESGGQSVTRIGMTKDGVTDVVIPDSMLENEEAVGSYDIYAFIYLTDDTSGQTEYKICMLVKARPKPEAFDKPEDEEIFQEAITAVRESADRAESAEQKVAQHAEQTKADAQKTTADRQEVEKLVESVSGIEEQVQAVKDYKEQAQTAATNALLSEQKSEQAKEAALRAQAGAETAADEAEQHALDTAGDKTEVERLATQVRQDKTSVEQTAQGFGNTVQQAEQSINTAKTQAVETVNATKTDAVKAVQTAAQEIIADREQIQTNKTDIADLRQGKADAIVETASGTLLNIKDSANASYFEDFSVFGKTEQVQTTGAQLLNCYKLAELEPKCYSVEYGKLKVMQSNNWAWTDIPEYGTLTAGTYIISGANIEVRKTTDNTPITSCIEGAFAKFTLSEDTSIKIKVGYGLNIYPCVVDAMLNKGDKPLSYEFYTDGKPSPSVEYPQEIVNSGRLNEDTGKYEVEVTINSSNLFKVTEHTAGYYVDKDGKVQITKTIGYSWTAVVNNLHKQTVILHITTAINTRYRMYCTDLEDTILYKYEDSSANTNDNSHTFNMPDGAKKIYVSVLEINSAEQAEIALNLVNTALPFEPYKEQTVTLTSDRPITKWDKIEKRDGVYGIVYKHRTVDDLATLVKDSEPIYGNPGERYFSVVLKDATLNYDYNKVYSEVGLYKKDVQKLYVPRVMVSSFTVGVNDTDTIETAKTHLHYKVIYETDSEEFVSFDEETQIALNALHTNYPTTVITNSEDCEMEVEYIADTKTYIDKKLQEIVTAHTQGIANLLSLMPLETQVTMIENDTNNILENVEEMKHE